MAVPRRHGRTRIRGLAAAALGCSLLALLSVSPSITTGSPSITTVAAEAAPSSNSTNAAAASAGGAPPPFHDLTSENFDSIVKAQIKESAFFVMFHVSWCGICKRTFPHFKEAAKTERMELTPADTALGVQGFDKVRYGHFDCTNDKAITERFRIRGYPTILFWDKGSDVDSPAVIEGEGSPKKVWREFRGVRNVSGFHAYVRKMTKTPVVNDLTSKAAETALEGWRQVTGKEHLVSYLYVRPSKDAPIPDWYTSYANEKRDLHSFFVAKPDMLPDAKAAVEGKAYVVTTEHMTMGRKIEAKMFSGAPSDFPTWASNSKFPGIWRLSDHNFYEYSHSKLPTVNFVLNPKELEKEKDAEGGENGLQKFVKRAGKAFFQDGITEASASAESEVDEENPNRSSLSMNVGIIDGVAWEASLQDFSIFLPELPRVLITVDDFAFWYEDGDAGKLDVETVFEVVKGAKNGGEAKRMLLSHIESSWPFISKQGRDYMSKMHRYMREFIRACRKALVYATGSEEQPMAFFLVFGGFLGGLALLYFSIRWIGFLLRATWEAITEGDSGDDFSDDGYSRRGSLDSLGSSSIGTDSLAGSLGTDSLASSGSSGLGTGLGTMRNRQNGSGVGGDLGDDADALGQSRPAGKKDD